MPPKKSNKSPQKNSKSSKADSNTQEVNGNVAPGSVERRDTTSDAPARLGRQPVEIEPGDQPDGGSSGIKVVGSPRTSLESDRSESSKLERERERADSDGAVRRRAYELYEQRGREEGRHEDDWLQAEREVFGNGKDRGKKERRSA